MRVCPGAINMERGRAQQLRQNNVSLGLHAEISVLVVPKQRSEGLARNQKWALRPSFLTLIITFQQNYRYNQLVVTPNDRNSRPLLLNDPLQFLSRLTLVLGSSQRRKFTWSTWCQDLSSSSTYLPLWQVDPSTRDKYMHVNGIQKTWR